MATIIKGGTVVTVEYELRANVLIDGETIVVWGSPRMPPGAKVIDASGAYKAL